MLRWNSFYDIFQFPLKLLFIGLTLLTCSNLVLNPNLEMFYIVDNEHLIIMAHLVKTIANFIIANFPFLVLIKMVSRKNNSDESILFGIIGYVIFLITTMIYAQQDLGSSAYSQILGLSFNTTKIAQMSGYIRYPLQTGLIGAISIGFSTRFIAMRAKNKLRYGLFSFIDRFSYGVILTIFNSFLLGLLFCFIWPYFIVGVNEAVMYIAKDIGNPVNLFMYGILDRLFSVFNLGGLIRYSFYFTDLGGSWIDMTGVGYAGDVTVWMAQMARNMVPSGVGRFITPYYIINLFAMPALIISFFTLFTDKIERKRIRLFFVLAIVVSLITGIYLPVEILLLVTAPILFFMHLFVNGLLYGVCAALEINIGFAYSGSSVVAMPGSIFDLLIHVRNLSLSDQLVMLGIVGVVTAIVYYAMVQIYYRFLALDLFNTGLTEYKLNKLSDAVGGITNVKMLYSSPFRLYMQVYDSKLINYNIFKEIGASKIVETKSGYAIDFGASSTIYRTELNKRVKASKRVAK